MKSEEKSKIIDEALKLVQDAVAKGVSKYRIANDTSINETTIGNYANGKTKPSFANAKILISYFDSFKIKDNGITINTENNLINTDAQSNKTRPRIPYDAAAGTLTETVNGISEYECEQVPIIGVFPMYNFTIRITGRSMEPEYYAGDEVACLKIDEARFIQWGRVHVLDTTQGVVIKRIYDNGDSIICRSYNPEFPDFSIPKEDIRSFNLVVGSVRL